MRVLTLVSWYASFFFFFNDTASTEIYTLSLHDALPISNPQAAGLASGVGELGRNGLLIHRKFGARIHMPDPIMTDARSEEHTSELQSRQYLVCRLLLEKKKKKPNRGTARNSTRTSQPLW